LLLTSQYRHPIKKKIWQFPGGSIEPHHSARLTAARELREETGFLATNLISLGPISPDPGIMSNTGFVFLAQNPIKGVKPPTTDSFENITAKIFPRQRFKNMIQQGKVRDGWTLSAFLLLQLRLNG
jgi:8-oxo-dGDP phosphatase